MGQQVTSTRALLNRRLRNQRLSPAARRAPRDIVAALGAVQSQDYAAAKWALGLRGAGLTDAAVEDAFNRGELLRTHVLRPTWHFVVPEDIRWMLALSADRVKKAMAFGDRFFGLDERTFVRANRIFERELRDGRHVSRPELGAALRRAGIATDGQRLAHLLVRAELDAVICSGARVGKDLTFALFEDRVPPASARERDESLAELTRRYFGSHGPASVADYSWWSGLTARDARRGIDIVRADLLRQELEGIVFWSLEDRRAVPGRSPASHLLPNFDEYLVAYRDGRGLVRHPASSNEARAAFFDHSVLIEGRVAGTWKRMLRKDSLLIRVHLPRGSAPGARRQVENAARRYADFVQRPIDLDIDAS